MMQRRRNPSSSLSAGPPFLTLHRPPARLRLLQNHNGTALGGSGSGRYHFDPALGFSLIIIAWLALLGGGLFLCKRYCQKTNSIAAKR